MPARHWAKHIEHAMRHGRVVFQMEIGRVEGFRFITSPSIDDHRLDAFKYMVAGLEAQADKLTGIPAPPLDEQ